MCLCVSLRDNIIFVIKDASETKQYVRKTWVLPWMREISLSHKQEAYSMSIENVYRNIYLKNWQNFRLSYTYIDGQNDSDCADNYAH